MEVRGLIGYLQSVELNNYQITTVDDIGGDLVINCPYHKGGTERTGSFSILLEDKTTAAGVLPAGTGHCFACGATKSLPQFVSDVTGDHNIEQTEEWLKREFNYSSSERMVPLMSLLPKLEELPTVKESLEYESYRIPKGYQHPFFEGRGITPESVQFFELGIDGNTYAVFPVKDKSGKIRMIFRRGLQGRVFHNTSGAKKEDILFALDKIYANLSNYRNTNQVWVVESIIDAILLWQRGFIAVAMLQAIPTAQQLELLQELPFGEIIIGTDNDEAGRKGRDLMREKLDKTLYTVIYPNETYKDIGDFKTEEQIYIGEIKKSKQSYYTGLPMG